MLNAKDAISKIKELLNLEFAETTQKFYTGQLEDGTQVTNNTDSAQIELGDTLYVVANDGNLVPAPGDMEHKLASGEVVTLDIESKVVALATSETVMEETPDEAEMVEQVDEMKEDEEFASARLVDGTQVTNGMAGEFEVGQKLFVITEDNEMVQAPTGSHTTESGIEVVVNEEGEITGISRPDEGGEGSLEAEKEEQDFTSLQTEIAEMKQAISQVLDVFSKFSASTEDKFEEVKTEIENFKKSPEVENIKNKKLNNKNLAQTFAEYRTEQLKKYLK